MSYSSFGIDCRHWLCDRFAIIVVSLLKVSSSSTSTAASTSCTASGTTVASASGTIAAVTTSVDREGHPNHRRQSRVISEGSICHSRRCVQLIDLYYKFRLIVVEVVFFVSLPSGRDIPRGTPVIVVVDRVLFPMDPSAIPVVATLSNIVIENRSTQWCT